MRARSGKRCAGRSLAGPASASISAMTRRKRAIPSALPPGDIRSAPYRSSFVLVLDRKGGGVKGVAWWVFEETA